MPSSCSRPRRFAWASLRPRPGSRSSASGLTAVAVGWPTALQPTHDTVRVGAIVLVAALWPVVFARARGGRLLAPAGAAVGVVAILAAVVVGAGARPSGAALGWEGWDPYGSERAGRTIALVWDSNYGGIAFPARKTTVLRIGAPRRSLYWRATTLDSFAGDRWVESLVVTALADATGRLPADPLLPAQATQPADWVEQNIEVRALVDDHIVGVGQPMEISGGTREQIIYWSGGVMKAPRALERLRRYTVRSYAPQPDPAALVRSPPAIRPPSSATATSAARSRRRSARRAGPPQSQRCSTTTAIRSCGPMSPSGTRPPISPPVATPRTRRRSRSSAGCARTAGSPTTSSRRRPSACRPSSTS